MRTVCVTLALLSRTFRQLFTGLSWPFNFKKKKKSHYSEIGNSSFHIFYFTFVNHALVVWKILCCRILYEYCHLHKMKSSVMISGKECSFFYQEVTKMSQGTVLSVPFFVSVLSSLKLEFYHNFHNVNPARHLEQLIDRDVVDTLFHSLLK